MVVFQDRISILLYFFKNNAIMKAIVIVDIA